MNKCMNMILYQFGLNQPHPGSKAGNNLPGKPEKRDRQENWPERFNGRKSTAAAVYHCSNGVYCQLGKIDEESRHKTLQQQEKGPENCPTAGGLANK